MSPSKASIKSTFNKKGSSTTTSYEVASRRGEQCWWERSEMSQTLLEAVPRMETQMKPLPKNSGVMSLFKKSCGIKLASSTTMCEVDENRKICLMLDDEQYEYLKALETSMEQTLINQLKLMNPNYKDSELKSVVRVSEQTGHKYLKTKIQLAGPSRSMGVGADGETVLDTVQALSAVGSKVRVRVRIDGVYVGKDSAGLVTKIDVFRVMSVPDEKQVEAEKEKRREDMEARRVEMLKNF